MEVSIECAEPFNGVVMVCCEYIAHLMSVDSLEDPCLFEVKWNTT